MRKLDVVCPTCRWPIAEAIIEHWLKMIPIDACVLIGLDGVTSDALYRDRIRIYEFPKSGASEIRNYLVAQSDAKTILFVDDDSYISSGSLDNAVRYLLDAPLVGALSFSVFLKNQQRYQNQILNEGVREKAFVGCGALVNRKLFLGVGGFCPLYKFYMEESYLCAAFFREGLAVRRYSEVQVEHLQVVPFKESSLKLFLTGRNKCYWDYQFSPVGILPLKLFVTFISLIRLSFSCRCIWPLNGFFRGIYDLVKPKNGLRRNPLSVNQFILWFRLI